MNFTEYQFQANSTAVYKERGRSTVGAIAYCSLGLAGEVGEVCNKIKKIFRDGDSPEKRAAIRDEMGDALWYMAALAYEFGWQLDGIAEDNLNKLAERRAKNTIHGEGDSR
jgi:NTP pyrophosphatase (non-canonical NTP hydrolase)